ncbi:kinase-like domain-containing protein [Lentinula detonsa]|uniref:Kinase-like domain-containing protein n=1 Tax=Lentinula detonsa TaxID=2804962 RepID=A0AA38Q4M4_9AGAR|nr:kinase-like domain-containing protein [Lentinula detonsa]
MIQHLRSLPLDGLQGIVPNLDAKFMKDPDSLNYGLTLSQNVAADGPPLNKILENPQGSLFTFPYKDGKTRTVHLKRVLFRSHGIIGRGTIVIRVKCTCAGCGSHCNWAGKKLVLKLSFPGENRVSEQRFMDRCRELAQGEHAWVLNHLPSIYWSFDIPFRDGTPQQNFKKQYDNQYEMRIMRGSIQEELQSLTSLTTARECAQVFYDVVQCHHWVWKYPQILHRDISPGNIMVREKNGENVGVLNDWDLAIWVNDLRDGPTSKFRTGTTPYMAHEQHFTAWKGPHRYRHDMESVFYVILLLTCLCSSPSEKLPTPPTTDYSYETWHKEGDDSLRGRKKTLLTADDWQPSTTTFFDGFSSWLDKLQQSLRQGLSKRGMHRDAVKEAATGEWQRPDPALLNFDEDTLGGRFSYEEIMWVVHVFENEDLKTRGREWQNTLLFRLQKEQQDEQRQKEQYKQQQEEPKKN